MMQQILYSGGGKKNREKGMTPGTTKYKSRVRNNKRKLATT